jgi:HSP20 family protein
MAPKRTFFERLTGSLKESDSSSSKHLHVSHEDGDVTIPDEESVDGQLAVDVYQTPDEIIIKTMVAGVKPDDLDIQITRDMVVIRGERSELQEEQSADYFHKELYWGTFSRAVQLPEEVEVEEAEAVEKHGLLILRLPKIDKTKQNKVKVKSL